MHSLPILLIICLIGKIHCNGEASIGLQSIIPTIDSNQPAVNDAVSTRFFDDSGNWTTLAEALDLFSVKNLARNWKDGEHGLNYECKRDITMYLKALKNHELWALKSKFFQY